MRLVLLVVMLLGPVSSGCGSARPVAQGLITGARFIAPLLMFDVGRSGSVNIPKAPIPQEEEKR